MKTITVELTEQEAQALLNLMDAGLRQVGLNAAANAALLARKIQDAAQQPDDDPPEA